MSVSRPGAIDELRPAETLPAPGRADALSVDAALLAGRHLATPAAALAFSSHAGDGFDLVDLPPVGAPDPADMARLQAVAALYLVAELEATLIVRAAEMLSGLYVSGALGPAVDGVGASTGDQLVAFWRRRHERFSPEERSALYARLFGEGDGPVLAVRGASNTAFEGLLIDLADVLYSFEDRTGRLTVSAQVALRTAAEALVTNLVHRNVGVPDQAGAELVDTVQTAVSVFKDPGVQQAFGVSSAWAAVQAVARRYLAADPPIAARVQRGRTGLAILAWLAGAASWLGTEGDPPSVDPAVVTAAGTWLTATLELREAAQPSSGR